MAILPETVPPAADPGARFADETRAIGRGEAVDAAILFVDLIGSSAFASVLGLKEYAEFVAHFHALCRRQCAFYFEHVLQGRYVPGRDYEFRIAGDELIVFIHSGRGSNDVYQLICLALALKCGWLCVPFNRERAERGAPTAELAAGIHFGPVWRWEEGASRRMEGFAINLAKRLESSSRGGERFRIYLSDPAFKQINRRMRNLVFGPRRVMQHEGILMPVGVHELIESFVNPATRLAPEFAAAFPQLARKAIHGNSFDRWIHSCLQVWEASLHGRVTDECLELCNQILNVDPSSAVALYHAAQAMSARGDLTTAGLYLEDLTRQWPMLGDGWLELARLQKQAGDLEGARRSVLQARRHGVAEEEEGIP